MEVEINLFGPLREEVASRRLSYGVSPDTTVGELAGVLTEDHPALADRLYEDGSLREDLVVTVNRTHVQYLKGEATVLETGDIVRITPPIVGG
jgi:molybdopterin synthase sulfur carrier subunit